MKLSGSRPWIVGGVLAAVAVVVLSWLLVIGPTRSDAGGLRDDTTSVQTQNDVLATRAAALRTQADDRAGLETQVRAALAAVPAEISLPTFNQELAQHAAARGVTIVSINVGGAVAPGVGGDANPGGILSVPITLETTGPRLAQMYFLRDLQEVGPRAVLVGSTSLTADSSDGEAATDVTDTTDDSTATKMTTQLSIFSHALPAADAEALAGVVDGAPNAG